MKKGIWFTILTAVLTAAVVVLPMIQAFLTEQKQPVASDVHKYKQNIVQPSETKETSQQNDSTGWKDANVLYMVMLKEPSVLDTFLSMKGTYANVRELLLSDAGKSCCDAVRRSQAVAKASITKQIAQSDFTDSRTFSALWNGLTVKAPLSVREKLAKVNGVSAVYVLSDEWQFSDTALPAEQTTVPEMSGISENTEEQPPENTEGKPAESSETPENKEEEVYYAQAEALRNAYRRQIAADGEMTEIYQGAGVLIAVLDSEFDVWDAVFSKAPDTAPLSKSTLSALSASLRLNIAENQKADTCYVSPKIAYAYDYAENDSHTADQSVYHGTLAAAIAAGNNGLNDVNAYRGAAPEAQLALMKIASSRRTDGSISIPTDALMAALDDAVKLGADVVNLSLGSEEISTISDLYQSAFQKMEQAGIAIYAAAGNNRYNGAYTGKLPDVSDSFYASDNTLSVMDGVTAVGSVENPLTVRHFITIGGQKFYYRNISPVPLTDIMQLVEQEKPSENSVETSAEESSSENSVETSAEESTPEKEKETVFVQHNEYFYVDAYTKNTVLHTTDVQGRLVIFRTDKTENLEQAVRRAVDRGAAAIALTEVSSEAETALYDRPLIIIEGNAAAFMNGQPSGEYLMNPDDETEEKESVGVSGFTAYSGRDLSAIGTRIMAGGEQIYAGTADNGRSLMSGTSAAVPTITGAYAMLRQYTAGLYFLRDRTPAEKKRIAESLMLSTAEPVKVSASEESALYASPRVQGFGLLQAENAFNAHAYLTTDGQRLRMISLGDGETGEYTFRFTLHNLSELSREYDYSFAVQTDTIQNGVNTLYPRSLTEEAAIQFLTESDKEPSAEVSDNEASSAEVSDNEASSAEMSGSEQPDTEPDDAGKENILSVEGSGSKEVTAVLTISPEKLAEMKKQCPRGFWLDGYIILTPRDGTAAMHLPFTGFYGSLEEFVPFDHTIYDKEKPLSAAEGSLVAAAYQNNSNYRFTPLIQQNGYLLYSKEAVRTITDNSSYGTAFILPDICALRDLYDYTVTIYDLYGQVLYRENFGAVSSYRQKDRRLCEKTADGNKGLREYFLKLGEGTYQYEVSARTKLADGSLSGIFRKAYLFKLDDEKPFDISSRTEKQNGRTILSLTASDNSGIQNFVLYAAAYDSARKQYDYIDSLDEMIHAGYMSEDACIFVDTSTNEDGSQTFRYDITNLQSELRKLAVNTETWSVHCLDERIAFKAVDNAYNASAVRIADTIEYGSAVFRFTDQDGSPAPDISVTIGTATVISDEEGLAVFERLAPNYYQAVVHCSAQDYELTAHSFLVAVLPERLNYVNEQTVTAMHPYSPVRKDDSSPDDHKTVDDDSASHDDPLSAFLFVGIFLFVCVVCYIFRRRFHN